ncbi:2-(3-amino-3-carboxypropyl)histidine synthase subunit 2-like [Brevipalpus obovatus]|uniref:2-(3-amino-3-carboxypropyl)histidine synthase subunit 2-like n=1 Tax=Brevipalpus obovatus TaxID=246614 RepID=UPI003D9F64C7
MSRESFYEIDQCARWIVNNKFNNVALQVEKSFFKDVTWLKNSLQDACKPERVKLFVIISDSCSVDHISPLHLGLEAVDSIIRFGRTCLAPFESSLPTLPVLFIFGNHVELDKSEFVTQTIRSKMKDDDGGSLILYDTNYSSLVQKIKQQLGTCEVGKLIRYSHDWHFSDHMTSSIQDEINGQCGYLGHFKYQKQPEEYGKIFYIGSTRNLNLRLVGPIFIDPSTQSVIENSKSRELTKRVSLIEKLRHKKSVSIGFIFTNSFPSLDEYLDKIQEIKLKKHKIFKILLFHSTDACKLGNFSHLDAFVLINSCNCTSLLDSLELHIPILTYPEYLILCGIKTSYGGVAWNQEPLMEEGNNSDEDELVSGPDNQLIENQSMEKPSWYGLEVNPAFQPGFFITEGQRGTASNYSHEPR